VRVLLTGEPRLEASSCRDLDHHLTLQHALNRALQHRDASGLMNVSGCSSPHRAHDRVAIAVGGQDQELRARAHLSQLPDGDDAIIIAEETIDEADVWLPLAGSADRVCHRGRGRHRAALAGQDAAQGVQEDRVVIAYDYVWHRDQCHGPA